MAAANQQATSIYDPILQQINAQYQRERDAAIARQQQMAAATDQAYASARDPLANVYNSAIQQGTELENAVSNRLKGVGDSRGTDFAARLAQMGAPQTGAAQELATKYKGADAAGFAKGMNDVGRLVSRGAEARGFLEKQPGLARQQSQADLAKSLQEMFSDYSDQTGELMANLPGQVQSIYDKLYGTASEENEARNSNAWKQVAFIQEQIQANQEAKIVAQQLGDKKAARAAQAQQKALDRELAQWKAQLSQETQIRGQDITARGQDMTDTRARDLAPKPGKPKPLSGSQSGVVRNEVLAALVDNKGFLRDRFAFSPTPDAAIGKVINEIFEARKVPKSERPALRKIIFSQINNRMTRAKDANDKPRKYKSPKWGLRG
jgi:hypothetical protein